MPKQQRQQPQQARQPPSLPAAAASNSSSHKKAGTAAPTTKKKKRVMVVPADAASSGINPSIPRSFIFRRGAVAPSAAQLIADLRLMMQPNSALKLQERKSNTMKDFLMVGPQLGISHFLCFTQSEVGLNMRLIRIPHGPTLTFRVVSYSTQRDVVNIQHHPHSPAAEYHHPPLVVLNNFNTTAAAASNTTTASPDSNKEPTYSHLPLLAVVLQHMFPPLHLPTLLLSHCRRVVLFHFDPETQLIDMRHYLIQAKPTGLTKPIQKVVQGNLPDLGSLDDISQYIHLQQQHQQMMTSDSEADNIDDAANAVVLPERYVGRGNRPTHRSSIRLHELGPRMTLSLLKIEEDFCAGRVLYHHYLTKSPEDQQAMRLKKEQRKREKEERRREQERNVKRKTGDEKAQEDRDGAEEKAAGRSQPSSSLSTYDDDEFGVSTGPPVAEDDGTDDEEWYEREVGEKPGPEVFGRSVKRADHPNATGSNDTQSIKKPRVDGEEKHKRVGGRRVGAGPRKPWIRGRGGRSAMRGGATHSRGRGSMRGRGR